MSNVKLPTRKKAVDLPERPKDRNAQTRERAQEQMAVAKAKSQMGEQEQELVGQVEAKLSQMSDHQKMCIQAYSEAIMQAGKMMAKAYYGPTGTIEMGIGKLDVLATDITELIIKSFRQDVGMNEFFAILGSSAGYQTGIAMSKSGNEMTEGMIKGATALFEGGLRISAETTKTLHSNQRVIRPASKLIQ